MVHEGCRTREGEGRRAVLGLATVTVEREAVGHDRQRVALDEEGGQRGRTCSWARRTTR